MGPTVAEPTVQVPVSLIEQMREALVGGPAWASSVVRVANARRALDALLSHLTPTAEPCPVAVEHAPHEWDVNEGEVGFGSRCPGVAAPPSSADMVPGTTFVAQFRAPDNDGDRRFTVMGSFWVRGADERWHVAAGIDPSTIRDVQPPKET